ncbi:Uncharacterised protein [uncultured archaeon]|nr:Uncharacterised protein [uncultured archaeon]
MLDKNRILVKLDEIGGYLSELEEIAPDSFSEYKSSIEKRRACERLLQIAIESVVDISQSIVKGMLLGMPKDEDSIFETLAKKNLITENMAGTLRDMKNFRNILVHRYGVVDDAKVFTAMKARILDFEEFKKVVLEIVKAS